MRLDKEVLKEYNTKEILSMFYYIYDLNKWLYESFKDYCQDNNITSSQIEEDKFYSSKNSEYYISGVNQYWIWQNALYECFNSINANIIMLKKIFNSIIGVKEIICNDNVIKISIDETLLNINHFNCAICLFNLKVIESEIVNNELLVTLIINKYEQNTENIKYLYYITSIKEYNDIKNYGILPRTKNEFGNYTNRIYLFKNISNEYLTLFKQYFDDDIIILKIDIEYFNQSKDTKMKLFGETILYTEEPIPTKYISICND